MNVRTYTLHNGNPGVYFFSLDASSKFAVAMAKLIWSLNYVDADMSVSTGHPSEAPAWAKATPFDVPQGPIKFQSKRHADGAMCDVEYTIGERLPPAKEGTLEFFLLERYYLFVRTEYGVWQGQVHHTPYVAHAATVSKLTQTATDLAGLPVEGAAIAHWSPGVEVSAYGPWRAAPGNKSLKVPLMAAGAVLALAAGILLRVLA